RGGGSGRWPGLAGGGWAGTGWTSRRWGSCPRVTGGAWRGTPTSGARPNASWIRANRQDADDPKFRIFQMSGLGALGVLAVNRLALRLAADLHRVLPRRQPHEPLEVAPEVALVSEADAEPDLGDRRPPRQQPARFLDAEPQLEGMRRDAEAALEGAQQHELVAAGGAREGVERQVLRGPRGDELARPLGVAGRAVAAEIVGGDEPGARQRIEELD